MRLAPTDEEEDDDERATLAAVAAPELSLLLSALMPPIEVAIGADDNVAVADRRSAGARAERREFMFMVAYCVRDIMKSITPTIDVSKDSFDVSKNSADV